MKQRKDRSGKRKKKSVMLTRSLISLIIHLQRTITLSIARAQPTTIAHPDRSNLPTMLTMRHLKAYPYNYQHSGDINAVGGAPFRPRPPNPLPGSSQPVQQRAPAYSLGNADPVRNRVPIDPIPYTYTELLPQLLQQNVLQRLPYVNPMNPPLPAWYDTKAHCDYHSGSEGHATENCRRLKYAVQDLVRSEKLSFGNKAQANPLPDHGKTQANMVGTGEVVKRKISEISTPLSVVFKALVKAEMIDMGEFGDKELEKVCPYHGEVHGVCECPEFREKVQKLMDEHQIEFCVKKPVREVSMTVKGQSQLFLPIPSIEKQFIQGFSIKVPAPIQQRPVASLIMSSPQSLSYTDDHQVPKEYENKFSTLSGEGSSTTVTDACQMTRNGRLDLQGSDGVAEKMDEESQGLVTTVVVENLSFD